MFDPFYPDPRRRDRHHDVHRQRGRSFFDDHHIGSGFPFDRGLDDMMDAGRGRTRVYSQVSRSTVTPDGRVVAESRVTRTINGVTESVWKRKDRAVCLLPTLCLNCSEALCRGMSMLHIPIQTDENGTRSTGASNCLRNISRNKFHLPLHHHPHRRSKLLRFHHHHRTRTWAARGKAQRQLPVESGRARFASTTAPLKFKRLHTQDRHHHLLSVIVTGPPHQPVCPPVDLRFHAGQEC